MNLLQATLPEYLADLAAAATLTALTWISRKTRQRKSKRARDHIPPP